MPLLFYPSILEWPALLMRDRRLLWGLMANTLSGGRSLSGAEPRARIDGGGLWGCTMSDIQVSSADQVRAWRALAARLDGGATPVVLANRDERFAPWRDSTTDPLESENSDGSTCSDGTSYLSDLIDVHVLETADLRDTELVVNVNNGASLKGGEYFSIQHPVHSHRLYHIGRVDKLDDYAPRSRAITVTIATPGVVTWTDHNHAANQAIIFTTSAALPTGLSPNTIYYVLAASMTTHTFRVALTPGGSAINTTGTQSGTHVGHVGGHHAITIRPPLREDVAIGQRCEFDNPKCIMQLATPDAMDLVLERRFHGQATVKFVESFPPWPGISDT